VNPIFQPQTLWLALPAAALLGAWFSWRSAAGKRRGLRLMFAALRFCAIAVAGLSLFNPGSWRDERQQRDGVWAVLLDRSASMAVADAGPDGVSRWQAAVEIAKVAAEAAGEAPPPRLFTYGTGLEPAGNTTELSALVPDGLASDLPAAGETLLDMLGTGGALTGILVIGDGRHVGKGEGARFAGRARAAGTKVITVAVGGAVPDRDLMIRPVRRQYIAFPGQRLVIAAALEAKGIGPLRTQISLTGSDGAIVGTTDIEIGAADGSAICEFEIEATVPGYYRYQLAVPEPDGDRNPQNNSAEVGVNVIDGKIAVFTLEGVPYWDSKFLIQLLRGQANVHTTSVYRLTAERYFRVATGDAGAEESKTAIFPDDLSGYDLLVFGKGCEYFLDSARVARLKSFVRDGGGAVIFARGKPYAGSFPELETMEPVVWGEPLGERFHFTPTAAGAEAGLFGHHLDAPGSEIWTALPELIDARRPKRLKAFARVLAEGIYEVAGRQRRVPVVISRRFGRGSVTTVNADGLWKWDFIPGEERARNMYAELWQGMILWSVTHSEFLPGQNFSLRLSESVVESGQPIRARVTARDASTNEVPKLALLGGDGSSKNLALHEDGEGGKWSAVFTPTDHGDYRLQIAATGVAAPLSVRPPPTEGDILSADPISLAALAQAAGGRTAPASDVAAAVAELLPNSRTVELANAVWEPAWDRLIWLLPVLGLLMGEWLVRRRNGLL